MSKVVAFGNLKAWAESIHEQGIKLVLTNGCFDLLHTGHVRYLQAAKELGDALLVAINSDASVRALKGPQRPINTQDDRAEIIGALECVNYVTIFDSLRVTEIIYMVHPTIYAKGGDYAVDTLDPEERAALHKVGADIQLLPQVPNRSTSSLINRLANDR